MASDEEKQLPSRVSGSDDTLSVEDVDPVDEQERVGFLSKWTEKPNEDGGYLLSRKGKQVRSRTLVSWALMGSGVVLISFVSFYIGYRMERPNLGVCRDDLVTKIVPLEVLPYVQGEGFAPYVYTTDQTFVINESDPNTPFYRRKPSHEVDLAWHEASRDHLMLVTAEDIMRQGKNPDEHVRLPDEWGYGEHKYPVRFWHLHRLHCLDSLRRMLYRDYYNETDVTDDIHAAHCIATLYEYLQCHPSWDLIHYIWVEGAPAPWSDWRRVDVCQSLDPMYELNDKHRDMPGSPNGDQRVRYLMPPDDPGQVKFPLTQSMRDYLAQTKQGHPDWPDLEEQWGIRKGELNRTLEEWHRTGIVPTWDSGYGWF